MSGCKKDSINLPSTFPELNGDYEYSYYNSWQDGLYEDSKYESWEFDDTREAWNYYNYWSYTSSGWINASKEGTGDFLEWKVEDDVFYYRYSKDNDWISNNFEFINESSFRLNGIRFDRQ